MTTPNTFTTHATEQDRQTQAIERASGKTALDRIRVGSERRFDEQVEAVRVGTIFAHDQKAYQRWSQRPRKHGQRGMTGEALERAIEGVARLFPQNVMRGAA